ncbi:MAG: hypothetical protein J5986_07155 [Roseburia sp.]|nr:hypothetical protein [Roseburia sp.]
MKKFSMIFVLLVTGLSVSACSVATNEKQEVTSEVEEMQEQSAGNTADTEKGAEPGNAGNTDSMSETEKRAGEKNTAEEDMVEVGQSRQISGYELVDGDSVPVTVTFTLKDVLRGDEAYRKLAEENAGLTEAPEGMEYVVADIGVSYDEGEAESLYLAKNEASLPSAKLYFALSNGDSNGEDLTGDMADGIYLLELQKGETGEGTVVFLHNKDSEEPLYFAGFDNVIKFDIKK